MKTFDQMRERVERTKDDSDSALFFDLVLFGEMVTKVAAAGLIAAIEDDNERHRYSQVHRLVRADGIGEWASAIEDVLSGPSSQHLLGAAHTEQRELMQRLGTGTWQYEAIRQLHQVLTALDPSVNPLPNGDVTRAPIYSLCGRSGERACRPGLPRPPEYRFYAQFFQA
ncbi:MAG TPA: hypothetical protein VIK11_07550 [Tepidiformaceae bacterium]